MSKKPLLARIGDYMDDVKSVFSPRRAAISKAERASYFGYAAAHETRKDAGISLMDNAYADAVDRVSRDVLRARARNLERNSITAGSIERAFANNVIGVGFNMQAESPSDAFNDRIEKLWDTWCHHENCDWTKQQSLDDLIELILRRMLYDGGIMATFPLDPKRKIPLTIQLHEVDELDESMVVAENGNIIVNGVEMTESAVPVAYWLSQTTPDGYTPLPPVRYRAEDVLFLWKRGRVTQFREITPFHSAIGPAQDLKDYNDAISFQQKTAACTSVYIETDNTINAPGRAINTGDNRRIEHIEGGSVKYLNNGEHAKFLLPTGQANEADNHIATQQRGIASVFGLSLESTSRNVERVNYSSARQNLVMDNVTYGRVKAYLEEYFLRPLYKRFIQVCYLKGLLDGTGFDINNDDFYEAKWLTSSAGWIDPLKEAQADTILLSNGGVSFQDYVARHGQDWKERIDEMAEVQEYAKKKGVNLSFSMEDLNNKVNGKEENNGEENKNQT